MSILFWLGLVVVLFLFFEWALFIFLALVVMVCLDSGTVGTAVAAGIVAFLVVLKCID
jgi:hypothetical protein